MLRVAEIIHITSVSSGGCDSTTTLHVTVTNLLTATVDTTVCANKVPFTWNGISVTGSGDYPYNNFFFRGCDSTTTLHVTVTNLLTATVDTTVCANKVPFNGMVSVLQVLEIIHSLLFLQADVIRRRHCM